MTRKPDPVPEEQGKLADEELLQEGHEARTSGSGGPVLEREGVQGEQGMRSSRAPLHDGPRRRGPPSGAPRCAEAPAASPTRGRSVHDDGHVPGAGRRCASSEVIRPPGSPVLLTLRISVDLFTWASVSFWIRSCPRLTTSSEISFFFSRSFSFSIASRRTLRTATRASSPIFRTSFASSCAAPPSGEGSGCGPSFHRSTGSAEAASLDRLLDRPDHLRVPGGDGDQAALGDGEGPHLLERRQCSVVVPP